MKNNLKEKQETILLIITSFNQLNNFLSYFLEKKLIGKNKIYLIIFSDLIPEQLILYFKKYIEKFTIVEVLDLRRKSINFNQKILNLRFFKAFFYYCFVLKKIFQIKKLCIFSYFITYSKIQLSTLFFLIFLSSSKIFIIEDGLRDYVPPNKSIKVSIIIFLLKKILILNKYKVFILQLARSRTDYLGLLNQPFLKKEYFLDNRELFRKFWANNSNKELFLKPKCILIGTKHVSGNFEQFKNLYIKILIEINKKYSFTPDQILFLPHPREKSFYIEELKKNLSDYSNIKTTSSIVVENYLSQNNLEIVVGTFSSALYYAKTIFKKNHVYYIDYFKPPNENNKQLDRENDEKIIRYVNIFHSLNINKIFIKK